MNTFDLFWFNNIPGLIIYSILMQEQNEKCNHNETTDELMPSGYIHYSKKICLICGKFLKWNSNPEIIKQFDQRIKIIQTILEKYAVNVFEKSFLSTIKTCKHLTPKQNEVWIKICDKYNNIWS